MSKYTRVNGVPPGHGYKHDVSQGAWTQALPPVTYPPYLCPVCGGGETANSIVYCDRCFQETGKYQVLLGQKQP